MREEVINCDFIWRRDGEQIVGVLDGRGEPRRGGGPGTCTFMSTSGKKFFADGEWTLTPETLWLYDINDMDGQRSSAARTARITGSIAHGRIAARSQTPVANAWWRPTTGEDPEK